ncbi:MAG: hypothetical protein GX947_03465 [Tissierellia bacterium]|nr:hypothetical protein [Tissierellia bacterium]
MGGLTKDVSNLKEGQNKIENELGSVKGELANLKKITIEMEQSHGKQLVALFDGYNQNADKLDRIEKEVSKHEEVILRRIK